MSSFLCLTRQITEQQNTKTEGRHKGRKEGVERGRDEGRGEGGRADLTSRAATVHLSLPCPEAVTASLDGPNNPKTANRAQAHALSCTSRRHDDNIGSDKAGGAKGGRERKRGG